ncbi:MAG TPA: TIGR04086 family membrane protein [Desulfotomaculum sp.]|nr:TIGR04086 family membrane protein [Desulfofundulus thermobenzoicus]HHW43625.1 TIGR04086 family membrane protein [Desulfotomaculum sp.]
MIKGVTFVHWNRCGKAGGGQIRPGAVYRGILWAFSFTLIAFVCFGLVLLSAGARTFSGGPVATAVIIAGAAAGGVSAGNNARNPGWLHGLLVGTGYGVTLVLLGVLAAGGEVLQRLDVATRLGTCTLAGAMGGVVGVNLPAPGRWFRWKEMLERKVSLRLRHCSLRGQARRLFRG